LTATAARCAFPSSSSSFPVSGQRGRVSTEGDGLAVAPGIGLGVDAGVGGAEGFEHAASPTPTTPNRTARRLICAI
jgi:hypothetical protein